MLKQAQNSGVRLWQALSWGQRLTIVGVGLVSLVVIGLIGMWATTPSYGVLFGNLSTSDAAAIVTQLGADKVPYQLSADGGTISVPTDQVAAERLKLSAAGLPQGGIVTLSLFDKQGIFQGDSYTQQINYVRGLEGELTQTIDALAGVSYANVHIVLPPTQLFASQQQDPTASVLVKMQAEAALSASQVQGIQHLIASSVQGLKPENVTVVDGNGTVLSQVGSSAAALGATALMAEQNYARTVEAQTAAMLDTILGPGQAVVHVSDVMDWTQRDSTSQTVAPQTKNSPIVQQNVVSNTASGPSSVVGGVPGLGSNTPTYGTSNGITNTYQQIQSSTNTTYATSTTLSHVVNVPGALTQLNVAVVLNGVTNARKLNALRGTLATALGLNFARGDKLTVTSVPFDTTAQQQAAVATKQAQQQAFILSIVQWVALGLVPLVLLVLMRRLFRVRRPDDNAEVTVEEVALRVDAPHVPALPGPRANTPDQEQRVRVQRGVMEMAKDDPQGFADLLTEWIEEGSVRSA